MSALPRLEMLVGFVVFAAACGNMDLQKIT
jgi:hypothetical protein